MAKQRRKRKPVTEYAEPTPEQLASGVFHRELVTYRRTPVIRTLLTSGKLTQRQFDGLNRYADIANLAERSELRSCIDFSIKGNGDGLPHFGVRMNIELGRLERALGALQPIAHAIAVRDVTLAQWAIQQAGSVMRDKSIGARIITWFEPRRKASKDALVEIRYAGEWLAAEIGA
jgi:hypothetical protein